MEQTNIALAKSLQGSQASNEAILNALPDLMLRLNVELVVEDFRFNGDEKLRTDLFVMIPCKYQTLFGEKYAALLPEFLNGHENGLREESFEFVLYTDSREYKFATRAAPVVGEGGYILLARDVTKQYQKEREQKELERRFSYLSLKARDQEQENLARQLHDIVGPVISNAIHLSQFLLRKFQANELNHAEENLDELIRMIKQAYETTRNISHGMALPRLKHLGLKDFLSDHLHETRKSSGLEINYRFQGSDQKLPEFLAKNTYQIIATLVLNCVRHANASRIDVQIRCLKGALEASIEDDGIGFDPEVVRKNSGLGLMDSKKRVESMLGEFEIDSMIGQGTVITFFIPIDGNPEKN